MEERVVGAGSSGRPPRRRRRCDMCLRLADTSDCAGESAVARVSLS